jgi:hypothetical protein
MAKQPILWAFRAPELGIRTLASREQQFLTMLTSLYLDIFHSWMEYEQRVIIRFLPQEDANANADDIHRRLHAQFTDDAYSIRSVRRWCQFISSSGKVWPPADRFYRDEGFLSIGERDEAISFGEWETVGTSSANALFAEPTLMGGAVLHVAIGSRSSVTISTKRGPINWRICREASVSETEMAGNGELAHIDWMT